MTKTKAFAYLRVSTTGQINGNGFDRQREEIEKYCKQNSIELQKVYEEQVSGTKGEDERPIFHQMVTACKTEDVKTIIIDTLDRFARRWSVSETLFLDLAVKGIDVIVSATGEYVTQAVQESPTKKLIVHILGGVAEYEYSQICEKLKRGRQASVKKNGEWRLPRYGHCGKDCNQGHSERCKHEKAILARIIHDRKTKTGKRKTFKQIAIDLNAENIFTRDGKPWNDILVFNVQNKVKS